MLENQSLEPTTNGYKAVGHSVRRTDGAEKVRGEIRYAGDLHLPGMLHARPVLSLYAHARIKKIEVEAALKVPGVVRVVTAAELPLILEASESRKRNPLAKDEVIFYGQPVAVVLGETEAAALDGANLVQVEYEELPAAIDLLLALQPNAPLVRRKEGHGADLEAQIHATIEVKAEKEKAVLPPNVSNHVHFQQGDVEAGFREAAVIVENTFRLPMVHQSYLEPQVVVAAPDPLGGLTVYSSTQAGFSARRDVAAALGLPQNKVKVVSMPVGGGFGGKFGLLEPWAAGLAKLVGRPVKLGYYRMEDLLAANPAPACVIEVKVGARADGTFCALKARLIFDTGIYPGAPVWLAGMLLGSYYRLDNYVIEGLEVLTNRPNSGAYRAPGAAQASFAIESQIDALAHALQRDPLELRLQNCAVEGDLNPSKRPWPRIGLKECLEKLQQHPAWQHRATKGVDQGIGIAVGGWPGGLEPATALCRLDHDGSFTVTTGISDLTGVTTSLQLIAAEVLGLKPEQVTVHNVDTDSAPYAGASGGSKTTLTVGAAVVKAAEDARKQVLEIAAQYLEASPEDLELSEGKVNVKGLPSRSVTLQEIANLSMSFGGRFEPVFGRGSSAITRNAPSFAVHLARVKVDRETGEVKVLGYVAVQDVGFAINPAEVAGQIHGGVTQGLGWALYEQMVYDETGTLLSGSLMDYTLQTAAMVPPIDVQLVEIPAPDGPFGAKGVGEPPIIPGAATIANAIFDAIGVRVTEVPATPERLLKAIWSRQF
ncbi:MAG: xanthine dehydrogenase family protein molybdopterin-binding subunit [Chloroflexota bacterium]